MNLPDMLRRAHALEALKGGRYKVVMGGPEDEGYQIWDSKEYRIQSPDGWYADWETPLRLCLEKNKEQAVAV